MKIPRKITWPEKNPPHSENLIRIASKLPWKVRVLLALVSYLGFHYLATQPSPSFAATDLKSYGQTIGGNVGRQLMITMSGFLQYIVAIAFLIGASVSFYKRRRHASRLVSHIRNWQRPN